VNSNKQAIEGGASWTRLALGIITKSRDPSTKFVSFLLMSSTESFDQIEAVIKKDWLVLRSGILRYCAVLLRALD
jgi:hypothetical protein